MRLKNNLLKITIVIVFGMLLLPRLTAKAQNVKGNERDSIPKNLDMTKYMFTDSAGKTVRIKDLKGKYVYLDVWASWCRPCINEFPFFDAMRAELKDKNIVFVQVSCDQVERRWRNGMGFNNRKAKDHQWWINGNEAFMKELRAFTIPRYLLIDKQGKLIDSFMTRASDPNTKTVLLALKGI